MVGSSRPGSGLREPEELDTGVGGVSMCIAGSSCEQESSEVIIETDMAVQREEGDEDGRDEDRMLGDMNACRRPCQDAWDSCELHAVWVKVGMRQRHSNLRCTRCTRVSVLNSSPTLLQISSASYPRQAFMLEQTAFASAIWIVKRPQRPQNHQGSVRNEVICGPWPPAMNRNTA